MTQGEQTPEGISELLSCSPVWMSEQNRITRVIASRDDYPSVALFILSRDCYRQTWRDP